MRRLVAAASGRHTDAVAACPLSALADFALRIGARCWIGAPPPGDIAARLRALAARLGYPHQPPGLGGLRATAARLGLIPAPTPRDPLAALVPLDRAEAAHVLAVAGGSLAYDRYRAAPDELAHAAAALAPLGNDAHWFSNGYWDERRAVEWTPLSAATFDAGVIGWDARVAFILWVEEED